ncbi:protein-tyrosine phosphatase-like protein, partial [Mucor lusitanicus]
MQECTSNIYQQGPACILPNLYLGAYYNALNATQLSRHGITCVINVASEVSIVSLPQHIEYHHIKWTHSQLDLAASGFERAVALIRTAHDRRHTVMVHCQQGIERSAALVVAFVMKSTRYTLAGQNWSFDRAFNFVREKAPKIRPNMELLYQLREYEQSI